MGDNTPTLQSVLDSCADLVDAGAALQWLIPRSKRPIDDEWSTLPVPDLARLKATYRKEANIGIRLGQPSKTTLGYIHLIDLDIRDASTADAAWSALRSLFPEVDQFPKVISGSGGESRHIYFVTSEPFRKRKLAKSETSKLVYDRNLNRDVKKNDWEIDLLGTGSYAVVPPSVHPDTGLCYRWESQLDADLLQIGVGPYLESSRVAGWGAARTSTEMEEDDDDLLADLRSEPIDIGDPEVARTIADLPDNWVEDRDSWVTVGAALHHQYQGGQKGFDIWCEWSIQSTKYDVKAQKSVWKSFRGDHRPVTMRTLIAAANEVRLKNNLPTVIPEEDDELNALLGLSGNSENTPKKPEIDENWTSYLTRNDEGQPTSTLHNTRLVVENDIRSHGIVALNEFTQEIVLVNPPKRVSKSRDSAKPVLNLDSDNWKVDDPVNGKLWTDSHDHEIRLMIEAPRTQGGYGFKVTDRDLKAAVDTVANKMRFHPVRGYLKTVEWDGKHRMDRLFIDYLGCDDTDYHREAARLTLIGAVARVMEPGHKFDFVPILEGLQGKRKSTFISVLGRANWFAELSGDIHNRQQMVEQIQGAWIIEIPELQGFSRVDTNVLKGFISATFDKVRMAYARRAQIFYRQCIFMGSTNDDEYLRDHTGGRRFWPIKCQLPDGVDIDTDRLDSEMDLIWAEAYQAYLAMREKDKRKYLPLFLQTAKAKDEAAILQESRRVETVEDSLAGTIEAWLDTPIGAVDDADDLDPTAPQQVRNKTCVAQIWVEMMGKEPGQLGQAEAIKIGKALARLDGWTKFVGRQIRTKRYGRQIVHVRSGATQNFLDNEL